MTALGRVLWEPPADAVERTRLGRFIAGLDGGFKTYDDAWRWSVDDLDGFWSAVWEFFDVRSEGSRSRALADASMPGAVWFPGIRLNYAEHALGRLAGSDPVVWSQSQTRDAMVTSADEFVALVARARTGLQRLGVGRGDRVAAYLPNITETLAAFLAAASLGAVWSSCPPEFGVRSVVDRFSQIEPKVLLAVDGYRYGTKSIDRRSDVAEIRAALPSVETTVHVPYLDPSSSLPGAVRWGDFLADASGPLEFERVPFDHPLYVLFSSGTTGLPKPIIHGHGGILLEHLKAVGLHCDLGPGDRFSWFTTTGWMMWNFLVSGLHVGAGVVLFDGDPGAPDLRTLWRMAADVGLTYLGVSAPFLMACRKAGLRPGDEFDLSRLRAVGSTGAPLPPEGFDWVYDAVSPDVLLSSISGGTDVCTAFVGGNPLLPVRAGVIACRWLGCKIEAFGPGAVPVIGDQGELVITAPMPSMPVGFWGDSDGSRYRAAYFEDYPGVWRHGDWITVNEDGSCVITGRSDATLNRGGVRLGTSDFYAVVEEFPDVTDSLVVHLDDRGGEAGELVLFVVLAPGNALDDDLRARIGAALRSQLSPRHVPDRIEAVSAVPRTLSGKKLEVPVKRILQGAAVTEVASTGALANPESLKEFVDGS